MFTFLPLRLYNRVLSLAFSYSDSTNPRFHFIPIDHTWQVPVGQEAGSRLLLNRWVLRQLKYFQHVTSVLNCFDQLLMWHVLDVVGECGGQVGAGGLCGRRCRLLPLLACAGICDDLDLHRGLVEVLICV